MGRHPGSYRGEKRRKELSRQKKQEEKRAKKQQRLANPEGEAAQPATAENPEPPSGQEPT